MSLQRGRLFPQACSLPEAMMVTDNKACRRCMARQTSINGNSIWNAADKTPESMTLGACLAAALHLVRQICTSGTAADCAYKVSKPFRY